jgi:hypothetical protein
MDMAAIGFFLMLVVLLSWPAILSSGSAIYAWRGLSLPWAYWAAATVVLYGLYFLVMGMFEPFTISIAFSQADAAHPSMPIPNFSLMRPILKPFAVFTVASAPVLAGVVRLFRRVERP